MKNYQDEILKRYFDAGSWRDAAEREPYKSAGINFATLRRYACGDPVYNHRHRKALGMQYKALVDSCPDCGEIHAMNKTCQKDKRKRHRIAISKTDPASAAASIANNVSFEISELIKELEALNETY